MMAVMQQISHARNGVIFRKNNAILTEPSSRMVGDSVAMTAMTAYLVLHQYFSWTRRRRGGSGNHHGEEVF
jgi:hypothetical protein